MKSAPTNRAPRMTALIAGALWATSPAAAVAVPAQGTPAARPNSDEIVRGLREAGRAFPSGNRARRAPVNSPAFKTTVGKLLLLHRASEAAIANACARIDKHARGTETGVAVACTLWFLALYEPHRDFEPKEEFARYHGPIAGPKAPPFYHNDPWEHSFAEGWQLKPFGLTPTPRAGFRLASLHAAFAKLRRRYREGPDPQATRSEPDRQAAPSPEVWPSPRIELDLGPWRNPRYHPEGLAAANPLLKPDGRPMTLSASAQGGRLGADLLGGYGTPPFEYQIGDECRLRYVHELFGDLGIEDRGFEWIPYDDGVQGALVPDDSSSGGFLSVSPARLSQVRELVARDPELRVLLAPDPLKALRARRPDVSLKAATAGGLDAASLPVAPRRCLQSPSMRRLRARFPVVRAVHCVRCSAPVQGAKAHTLVWWDVLLYVESAVGERACVWVQYAGAPNVRAVHVFLDVQ